MNSRRCWLDTLLVFGTSAISRSATLPNGCRARQTMGNPPSVAGERGVEPLLARPKRTVLPLNDSPKCKSTRSLPGLLPAGQVGLEPTTAWSRARCATTCAIAQNDLRPEGAWSGKRDSDPQHAAWKAATLPIELFPQRRNVDTSVPVGSRTPPSRRMPGVRPLHHRPDPYRHPRCRSPLFCP